MISNMSKWSREAVDIAKIVRALRREGVVEELAIVLRSEITDNRRWLAKRDYENQLMQECINGMICGNSPCLWCEDHSGPKPCDRPEHMRKGCTAWWLRFLTHEEEQACEARAEGTRDEEKHEGITADDVEKESEKLFEPGKSTGENVKVEAENGKTTDVVQGNDG